MSEQTNLLLDLLRDARIRIEALEAENSNLKSVQCPGGRLVPSKIYAEALALVRMDARDATYDGRVFRFFEDLRRFLDGKING